MSSPSTSTTKITSMTNAKRPCEHCPECAKRNVQSRLRHYKVNLDSDSFKMCDNDQCLYPLMTKELDDILVSRDVFGRKNRGKRLEMNNFGDFSGCNRRCSSNKLFSETVQETRSNGTDDVLRDLFIEDEIGIVPNDADVANLVSMLETVTSDVSVPVMNNETISNTKKQIPTPKRVSKNQINTKSHIFEILPSNEETGGSTKPVYNNSRASKVRIRTPKVKSPKTVKVSDKMGNDGDSSESQSANVEPPKEVSKCNETQTKSRNPLMTFLIAKQKAKECQRPVITPKIVETTQKTVISRSPQKSKTNTAKDSPRKISKDVTTTNRMVTSWLSSANADGKTTFPSYLSTVKQKDDGFVSEDSGIQSPQSLLSGESEPVSIRQLDAVHQTN